MTDSGNQENTYTVEEQAAIDLFLQEWDSMTKKTGVVLTPKTVPTLDGKTMLVVFAVLQTGSGEVHYPFLGGEL